MKEILLHSESCIKLYEIDDRQVLLCSTRPDELYFTGIMNVKCLLGSIEIIGFQLTPSQSAMTFYSSKENYVLKIAMLKDSHEVVINESYLRQFEFPEKLVHKILAKSCLSHLILLSKNKESVNLMSVLKYYQMPVFFREDIYESISHFLLADTSNFQKYQEHDDWHTISNTLRKRKCPKTILCGGQGVGKSTLLKFLVNKSLMKWPEVVVIDLDPGQSEFTVMGCLSAVVIRQPLTGPNFSHLLVPEKCLYFGEISVMNASDTYIYCVENLMNYCRKNFNQFPWFINTMGFTEGLGVKLLFNIMENSCPTNVIQIISNKKNRNFPEKLLPNVWRRLGYTKSNFLKYELHSLPSITESKNASFDATSWGLNSATKRNIVTLSYFSSGIKAGNDNLSSLNPRKISFSNVKILIDKSSCDMPFVLNKLQVLCCINANLVALCYGSANNDILDCIGFGIVRGFDENAEELYIITPISDDQFQRINVISMSSSIQLPEIVYQKQKSTVDRPVPYMMHVSDDILHQKIKKSSSRLKHRDDQNETYV